MTVTFAAALLAQAPAVTIDYKKHEFLWRAQKNIVAAYENIEQAERTKPAQDERMRRARQFLIEAGKEVETGRAADRAASDRSDQFRALLGPTEVNEHQVQRKKSMKRIIAFGILALSLMTGAANAEVAIRIGPPPPPREVMVVRPSPRHVWIQGHYRWTGNRYVWDRGYWTVPPRDRAVWVPGRWDRRNGGHFWIQGYWR